MAAMFSLPLKGEIPPEAPAPTGLTDLLRSGRSFRPVLLFVAATSNRPLLRFLPLPRAHPASHHFEPATAEKSLIALVLAPHQPYTLFGSLSLLTFKSFNVQTFNS